MSWLHALHIGIGSAERGNIEEPKILFQESLKLYPNPIAARYSYGIVMCYDISLCGYSFRNLAVLQTNPELAWTHFTIAWEVINIVIIQYVWSEYNSLVFRYYYHLIIHL